MARRFSHIAKNRKGHGGKKQGDNDKTGHQALSARLEEKLQAPDIETAKAKLRRSFEKGFISVEQLKKANSEMQAQSISRILKAFLEGAVDEKTFGELY